MKSAAAGLRCCAATTILAVLFFGPGVRLEGIQDIDAVTKALADFGQSQLTPQNPSDSVGARAADSSDQNLANTAAVSQQQQQQLCTSGFSTYSSSKLFETELAKHPKPVSHKALWPLDSRDWWAFGIASIAVFVAAGGGIGGGGVLVPLFASVLGVTTPLNACSAGGGVTATSNPFLAHRLRLACSSSTLLLVSIIILIPNVTLRLVPALCEQHLQMQNSSETCCHSVSMSCHVIIMITDDQSLNLQAQSSVWHVAFSP